MADEVLGLDPGFASVGWARFDVASSAVIDMGVVETKKSSRKQLVLSTDDNLRRVRELSAALAPMFREAKVICAEAMSFPRNSSAAAKVAMSWGVIATFSEIHSIPIVQVAPQDVKKVLCGAKNASKGDIQHAVGDKCPKAAILLNNTTKARREHMADALAVILASLDSDILRMIRRNSGGNAGY